MKRNILENLLKNPEIIELNFNAEEIESLLDEALIVTKAILMIDLEEFLSKKKCKLFFFLFGIGKKKITKTLKESLQRKGTPRSY